MANDWWWLMMANDEDIPRIPGVGKCFMKSPDSWQPCMQFSCAQKKIRYWLVVWNINFIFPCIGLLIIPIDFHIFQRGGPTTNQRYQECFQRWLEQERWWRFPRWFHLIRWGKLAKSVHVAPLIREIYDGKSPTKLREGWQNTAIRQRPIGLFQPEPRKSTLKLSTYKYEKAIDLLVSNFLSQHAQLANELKIGRKIAKTPGLVTSTWLQKFTAFPHKAFHLS